MSAGPGAARQGPKTSISACTTYPAPFAVDLAAYAEAGAQGIGLWEWKLPKGDDEASLERLRKSGLAATVCVPEVPSIVPDRFFATPVAPSERREALCASIRRFARFEPAAVLCLTGDPALHHGGDMRRVVVDGLRTAAEVALGSGVVLAVEPLRRASGSLATTLEETLDLVDEIAAPNVRVVMDAWHCWDLPGILDSLRTHAGRLVAMQVNDRREPTRSWCDRTLPGDGTIDLRSMIRSLQEGGFDGWYDIEVFSDDGRFGNDFADSIWKLDPHEVARRGVGAFRRIWAGAG